MANQTGTEPGVTPSDVVYDDMTRAWRNEDYPLAWSLADALLRYVANGGQPLTRTCDLDRHLYYVRQIHAHYAPALAMLAPACTDPTHPNCR